MTGGCSQQWRINSATYRERIKAIADEEWRNMDDRGNLPIGWVFGKGLEP